MPPSSPASGERASGVRAASTPALEADWLGACRTATAELRQLLAHGLSLAVADGPTMADVAFGYVYDFATHEEWVAHRGGGVLLNGLPAPAPPGERHDADGRLEIVAIESADPRWVAASAADLAEVAHRFRALGTIAVALCQLAATRVDGFVTLWRTRAVDVAAAQLIVR